MKKLRQFEESEKRFGLCQSQQLPFCGSGGDCVDSVAQASVLSERVASGILRGVRTPLICLLVLGVRVFITSGLLQAPFLHER